jgi:alpha-mannosidase
MLFNQFHDTLGGTSNKQGEDEAIMAFGRVILGARELTNNAGRTIAAALDTSGPGSSLVIFNPFPQPLWQYLEYEPWTEWQAWDAAGWGLVDEAGQPVPHQVIEADAAMHQTHSPVNRLVFPVDLPPLGYRVYRFAPGLPRSETVSSLSITSDSLANDFWRLRLDPTTGAIISCVDQATSVELVGPAGWNVAQVLHDRSDTWSHGLTHYDNIMGQFKATDIKIGDRGPLQVSLLIERVYEGSTWLQQLILRRDDPALLLRNWLCWQGQWQLVKLAFQVPTDQPRSYHDVPFGWLKRPCSGQEVPTQMWLDVQGPLKRGSLDDWRTGISSTRQPSNPPPALLAGLALLNDGKYSCDVRENIMRLTLLRTPPYAFHDPHVFGSKRRYDWVDQGYQEFNLVLLPHLGDWRETDLIARARALNLPPVWITSHSHSGRRPPRDSLAQLIAPELELTALKPAEDGLGFAVRIADKHGRGGSGQFTWQGYAFEINLAPFEVSTWRLYEENGRWQLVGCDMLERKLNNA